jgi:hypothetical protein
VREPGRPSPAGFASPVVGACGSRPSRAPESTLFYGVTAGWSPPLERQSRCDRATSSSPRTARSTGSATPPRALGDLPAPAMGAQQNDSRPAAIEFLCCAYRLEGGQVHLFLRRLPDIIRMSPDYDRHPELRSLIALLDHDVTQRRSGTGVTRSALVDLLLVHVLRLWQEEQGAAAWPAIDDAAIATALREIHQSPHTPWTVQRLSERAGISRTRSPGDSRRRWASRRWRT